MFKVRKPNTHYSTEVKNMKVLKGAVKRAFENGAGQLPQYEVIGIIRGRAQALGAEGSPNVEEIPDDWVVFMHSSCGRYAVSKREKSYAFLFLSQKGFDDNKDKYSSLVENGTIYGMEKKLKETWDKMDKGTKQYMKKLQKKLRGETT